MAVQAAIIQKQKEQKAPEKDPLDYLLQGLQIANTGFGIASNYQSIQNAKQQRELALAQSEQDKQAFAQNKEMNDLKIAEAKNAATRPKADYTTKELDELVSKGGFRLGKEGEKGEVRSVLLPDNQTKSVLLVDTNPEKAANAAKEKALERQKDYSIAKLNNDSKLFTAEARKSMKDQAYEALPKESKVQIDKIAGSMGDVTAVRNSLQGDLEAMRNAKTESEKLTIAQSMIKTLNSKMGKDAVGNEEAARLAPYLEYQKFNLFGPGKFLGRDLGAFEKQVEASMSGMDRAIELGSNRINELKGVSSAQPVAQGAQGAQSNNNEDQAALQWAQQNANSRDPDIAAKALAILNSPNILAMSKNKQSPAVANGGVKFTPAMTFGRRP